MKLKQYYLLTKPGIVRGNLMAATAGYLFGVSFHINIATLLGMLGGLGCIIASGCVVNNYLDRDIDRRMNRTKNRALVTGDISVANAMSYAVLLGILGTVLLLTLTNVSSALLALFGWFAYVVIYGIGKRATVHGTLIGSISGAIPPVVGYVAATNALYSVTSLLLFLVLVAWQMPHFYAIAMFRYNDYKSAKIPVLPVVKGMHRAKIETLAYIIVLILASLLLTVWGKAGYIYSIVMTIICAVWLYIGLSTFRTKDDEKWGKTMFLYSILVLPLWSILLPFAHILP